MADETIVGLENELKNTWVVRRRWKGEEQIRLSLGHLIHYRGYYPNGGFIGGIYCKQEPHKEYTHSLNQKW